MSIIPEPYQGVVLNPCHRRVIDEAPVVMNEHLDRPKIKPEPVLPSGPTKAQRAPINEVLNTAALFEVLKVQLAERGMLIVPMEPTEAMVNASMVTVTNSVLPMSKREKHRRRLQAALTSHQLATCPETL